MNLTGEMSGKVALITGANGGLGRATAQLFAAEGARLALLDLQDIANEAVPSGSHVKLVADVRDNTQVMAAVEQAIAAFGRIDILCHVAGIGGPEGLVSESDPDRFDRVVRTNLHGTYYVMRAVLPGMVARGGGSIVNWSSAAALMTRPSLGSYHASKSGVVALTKAVAVEYGPSGVRANALCPGAIETDELRRQAQSAPGMFDQMIAGTPLRRMGDADDIAQAALFLAGPRSKFITGVALAIDGGVCLL